MKHFQEGVAKGHRLHQFLHYITSVFGIGGFLAKVTDGRSRPKIKTQQVMMALLMSAVLRVPSLNQLEHLLRSNQFRMLLGQRAAKHPKKALFSADTISDVLDSLDMLTLQLAMTQIIKKAERNKAFRDDTFGTFICAAIDGWEPFCSYDRHCDACLTRKVKRKVKIAAALAGEDDIELDEEELEADPEEYVTQYYHRYVVAFLIAPKLDLTLAIEPIRTEAERVAAGERPGCGDEGEITAALRLIERLHDSYGCFIDAFALDGLYPCGPVFDKLSQYNYGACVITKNRKNDPYRFADEVWAIKDKPDLVYDDPDTKEHIEFFRLNGVDALSSFDGSVDMLKAVVTKIPKEKVKKIGTKPNKSRGRNINIGNKNKKPKTSTWVMALVGKAKRLKPMVALRIMRARWHIENTAFHQWVTRWNFGHCFRHTPNAIHAVMHIWAIAFNLMQLFFYRRLNKPRRKRKANDTIVACVKTMWLDLGTLNQPLPWHLFTTDTG